MDDPGHCRPSEGVTYPAAVSVPTPPPCRRRHQHANASPLQVSSLRASDSNRDPYELLGVARGATEDDIKKAHRKLVKQVRQKRWCMCPEVSDAAALQRCMLPRQPPCPAPVSIACSWVAHGFPSASGLRAQLPSLPAASPRRAFGGSHGACPLPVNPGSSAAAAAAAAAVLQANRRRRPIWGAA